MFSSKANSKFFKKSLPRHKLLVQMQIPTLLCFSCHGLFMSSKNASGSYLMIFKSALDNASSKRSPPLWLLIGARKKQVFWHQSEARTVATVWNWSGKILSPGALLAVLYFSSCHIFPPV